MKELSTMFGDGTGNYSMLRVIMFVVIVALIATKFYNAHLTGEPVTWTNQDLGILGTLIGGKVLQNVQENDTPPETDKTTNP